MRGGTVVCYPHTKLFFLKIWCNNCNDSPRQTFLIYHWVMIYYNRCFCFDSGTTSWGRDSTLAAWCEPFPQEQGRSGCHGAECGDRHEGVLVGCALLWLVARHSETTFHRSALATDAGRVEASSSSSHGNSCHLAGNAKATTTAAACAKGHVRAVIIWQ